MRILQVTSVYYPELQFGGPPQKIHALSRGLVSAGHRVEVLTFLSTAPRENGRREIDGVTVNYLPWTGRGLKQWPRERERIAERVAAADIVHCYGLYNALCPLAMRAARQANKPAVLEPLGTYVPRGRSQLVKRIYHRLFTRSMARHAALVIATSAQEFEELKPLAAPPKLVQRPNGIDVSAFRELPEGRNFRHRLNLPEGTRLVLFVGRLSPVKNLIQLVAAFAAAKLSRARLVLVGPSESDYEADVRAGIARHGLERDILILGPLYRDELREALAAADLFVLPSLMESYGNAAAEAVAANVPVLLTATCGIAPVIDGRFGLAVPLGEQPLAAGLRTLLDDPVARARFCSDRAGVLQDIDWGQPLQQTIALYRRLTA